MGNIYNELLKEARTVRNRHIEGLAFEAATAVKNDWTQILDQLSSWKKEATKKARTARNKLCGPVLSDSESIRIQALEGWISGDCSLDAWRDEVLASELTPRTRQEQKPEGWEREWVRFWVTKIVTSDIRSKNAV